MFDRARIAATLAALVLAAGAHAGPSAAQETGQAAPEAVSTEPSDPADPAEVTPCPSPDSQFSALDSGPGPAFDQPFARAMLGAANGAVRLIVFIDYACPACRESQPVIDRLIAENPDLTVVYRMVPNDPGGDGAAGTSLLVARSTGNWPAFHRALDAGGSVEDTAIGKAVAAAGLDPKCFPKPDEARFEDSVRAEFARNETLLAARKLKSFPSWVIGKSNATDGIDYDVLTAAIARARGH